jgi:hypothetical protein
MLDSFRMNMASIYKSIRPFGLSIELHYGHLGKRVCFIGFYPFCWRMFRPRVIWEFQIYAFGPFRIGKV